MKKQHKTLFFATVGAGSSVVINVLFSLSFSLLVAEVNAVTFWSQSNLHNLTVQSVRSCGVCKKLIFGV